MGDDSSSARISLRRKATTLFWSFRLFFLQKIPPRPPPSRSNVAWFLPVAFAQTNVTPFPLGNSYHFGVGLVVTRPTSMVATLQGPVHRFSPPPLSPPWRSYSGFASPQRNVVLSLRLPVLIPSADRPFPSPPGVKP